jgi:hypothetical protein
MSEILDPVALRNAYDGQRLRWGREYLPPGVTVEPDGALVRVTGPRPRLIVSHRFLGGIAGAELTALIDRQCAFAREHGQAVEWKVHTHEEPTDLAERLVAAGFVARLRATVVVGLAARLATAAASVPPGTALREVRSRIDLDAVGRLQAAVWGLDFSFLGGTLATLMAADPAAMTVVVAEADAGPDDGTVLCAGWIQYLPGGEFATLLGGATLARWRGRGLYKAMIAYRARLATARDCRYVHVEATENSRPILERRGLVAVADTVTYVYPPP